MTKDEQGAFAGRDADGGVGRLDVVLADIRRLVEIETPTANVIQAERCATAITEIGRRLLGDRVSVRWTATPDGPLVTMAFGSGPPRVAHIGHYDSVQPIGTILEQPFRLEHDAEHGTVLRGPATYDMKAGIVTMLHGIAIVAQAHPVGDDGKDPLDGTLLYFNPDEEQGSRSTRGYLAQLQRQGLTTAVVYEGRTQGAFKTERLGAMWPYIDVAPAGPSERQVTNDMVFIEVTVYGQDGHPAEVGNHGSALVQAATDLVAVARHADVVPVSIGTPEEKLNRTPGVATFVVACDLNRVDEVITEIGNLPQTQPGVVGRKPGLVGPQTPIAAPDVILQVCDDIVGAGAFTIEGASITPTVVAQGDGGGLRWVADCRVATPDVRTRTLLALREQPGNRRAHRSVPHPTEVTGRGFYNGFTFGPMVAARSERLWRVFQQVGARLGIPVARTRSAGVSDASHAASLGLDVIDGCGPNGGGDHGPREYVEADSLATSVQFTAAAAMPALQLAREIAHHQVRERSAVTLTHGAGLQ